MVRKYSYDYDDVRMEWIVIKWDSPSDTGFQIGSTVYRDDKQENAAAMCEEYLYAAECEEWALNNNQESEFDYV